MDRGTRIGRLTRLSLVWGCVMGGLGAIFPFYSLFLRGNAGLSGLEVGTVVAIPPLVGLVMHPVWGQVADRGGSRARVFIALAAATALGYLGLGLVRGYVGYLVATAGLALFSVAVIPSLVGLTLALSRDGDGHELGRVRVWGTVGFGVVVGGFPWWLDAYRGLRGAGLAPVPDGAIPGFELIFWVAGGALALAALLGASLPRGGAEALRAERGDWHDLLRQGPFLRVLAYGFFGFLALQGPMSLFPILVRAQGGGIDAVSRMWLLMLLLEVPLVAWLGASVARLGLRPVIGIGVAAGGLRWVLSGYSGDLAWMTAAQILHGVTVWGVIMGLPMYVDRVVPLRSRSTGQGLLAMIAVSLGGFLSNVASGWLIDVLGPEAPARIGGCMGLALAVLTPLWLPPVGEPPTVDLDLERETGAADPESAS